MTLVSVVEGQPPKFAVACGRLCFTFLSSFVFGLACYVAGDRLCFALLYSFVFALASLVCLGFRLCFAFRINCFNSLASVGRRFFLMNMNLILVM